MITILLLLSLVAPTFAQWTQDWTGPAEASGVASGWLSLTPTSGTADYRFYTIDTTAFRVMSGAYSSTPLYTYTFTAPERAAGEYIYSLDLDLTGDNIVEFYVLGSYGTASPYRQSFRILNLVTGATIFQRDDPAFSFGTPSVWDVDGDARLEGVFSKSPYPSGANYVYEAWDTGISGAAPAPGPIPLNHGLRQNSPNPFNSSTRIQFELNQTENVSLAIFNSLGQRVRTLLDETRSAGAYSVTWDGRDDRGAAAASGAYFYSLERNSVPDRTLRMILLR